jgi:hypothetical protein
MNTEFEKIMYRSKEELANISWIDLTHPDDLIRIWNYSGSLRRLI